ncbi:Glycosyltransferase involved in cell wall bisynthesis [Ruminococcus flavefaciens]|uniref:Glycosyltransferase involved in cell wall bisynthesis n=1 Tax=Ruminococcus flavefaciens TaxID=1265 RepID=A0A1H6JX25_RUMFL|nr:glycosyltransferase [Ruminococcus flavefaciens]SEH64562.1 Glycosyltransferase involved in cell wall bisynthesis [Ruminococcus flavefaciens]
MKIVYTRSSTIYDDSRASKEISAFLEAGYKVIVLGWDRNKLAVEKCKELFKEYNNSIKFRFYSGNEGKNKINKILSRINWNKWLKKQLYAIKNIDIIHSCDYDTGAVVRKFALKKHIKYVYDIFDYYIDAHPVPAFMRDIIEKDEIRTINDSEATIICTEERREQIKKSSPKKVLVIHNSPEVEEIEPCVEIYDYVYCGSLFGGRLIKEILDFYPKNSDLKFVFAGYGEFAEYAQKLDTRYDNFTFLGSIPYSEVLDIEQQAKVISAIYEPTIRNHQLCAPNKFYEALALGKPVIACKGTGIDKIVEKNRIGISIDYSAENFYDALRNLLNDENERKKIRIIARNVYDKKYKWSLMKKQLLGAYKDYI